MSVLHVMKWIWSQNRCHFLGVVWESDGWGRGVDVAPSCGHDAMGLPHMGI